MATGVADTDSVTVRPARTFADYRACQEAQRRAWGIASDGYLVPVATMVGAQLHGGQVLGAFLPSGEAVGLAFAFLGRSHGRLCLYSQLTGIVPEHQGQGIGARLKQAQWQFAREQGLALVVWAFDPLQAGNAAFNLAKLGATAGQYIEDMYGPRTDQLNAGLPTDRLVAEWETQSTTTRPDIPDDWAALPRVLQTVLAGPGAPIVEAVRTDARAPHLLLEIPDSLAGLRDWAPDSVLGWRLAVRAGFQHYFGLGYRAITVLRVPDGAHRRCFYVLHKAEV